MSMRRMVLYSALKKPPNVGGYYRFEGTPLDPWLKNKHHIVQVTELKDGWVNFQYIMNRVVDGCYTIKMFWWIFSPVSDKEMSYLKENGVID